MNKKNTMIILGAFCILLFGLLPIAAGNDYIKYGDVKSSFNASFNGGKAIELRGNNELVGKNLPAVLEGLEGRIIPWIEDQALRYEDAKGIWSSYLISELDLMFWANFFGFTYETLNEGCKYFMSWFYADYYLDEELLDITTTPLKRGQFYLVEPWGDEVLWWYNEGILYKPCGLERGTHNLETFFYMNIPGIYLGMPGITILYLYDYSYITFDIV
jgi:hypothetical protein